MPAYPREEDAPNHMPRSRRPPTPIRKPRAPRVSKGPTLDRQVQRHDPRITDKGAVEYTEATYQVSVGNMLLVYGRRQDGQPFIAALYNSNSWGGVLTLPREIATPAPSVGATETGSAP